MVLSSIIFLNYFMSEIKEKTEQKSLNDYDTRAEIISRNF